ncbi:MAG: conjugative transfer signal peptidase TraF [Proteobacteria bacterium]|nr:MAG: conjugative transfer signal peptidase TraF [Pseudomonadota bacterium]
MRTLARTVTTATSVGGITLLLLGAACQMAGARINTSKSIPVGLYWTTSAPMDKGAYVVFCPPPSGVFNEARVRGYIGAGFCPGGYGYLMKLVAATQRDTVTVSSDGVRVNGERWPQSMPCLADKAGRPLPRFEANGYVLGQAEVLLMSNGSTTAFDGRYFGPVSRAQLETAIKPILTW